MTFAFWRRDNDNNRSSYSLFGKLQGRPDFIRINASSEVACEYDQLLASAIDHLTRDPGWEGSYDATQHAYFAYRSRESKSWFVGCQCPSRDSGGRRFPLVGGLTIKDAEIGANSVLVPLAYDIFYTGLLTHLQAAMESSSDAVGCKDFLEGFSCIINQTGTDFELAQTLLDKHLVTHSADDLQQLLRSAYPYASLMQAVLNVTFYASFIRHFPSRLTAQEIVLPIPSTGYDNAIYASLWLGLVARLTGDFRRIAGFYFRDNFIVIAIDLFSAGFSPLLPLTRSIKLQGVTLSTEHETWTSHPLYPETCYAISRLLSEPSISINTLFNCAEQIGRRVHQSH